MTIVYDGDGNRVSETASGTITKYLVDHQAPTGYAQINEELVSGAVTAQFTYGPIRVSQRRTANSFHGYDTGGSVRVLFDNKGAVIASLFVMIGAPQARFVGMAAPLFQLVQPWVLVTYAGFIPSTFTFGAARSVTMPPYSLFPFIMFSVAYNLAVGVAFTYVELISQRRLLGLAAVLALPLFGATLMVDTRGQRRWNWAVVAFLGLASFSYSYWALRWIKIVFDGSPNGVVCSSLEEKSQHFRGGLRVRVQPWGPVQEAKAVQVPRAIYKALEPKGPVCLVTRSGALGVPWYTAQVCPWTGQKVTLGGAD